MFRLRSVASLAVSVAALGVAGWQGSIAYQRLADDDGQPRIVGDVRDAMSATDASSNAAPRTQAVTLAIFGTGRSAPVQAAVPETENTDYRLLGVSVKRDGDGLAIIETDKGVGIFRTGDRLIGGERVGEITADLVTLRSPDGDSTLRFEDQALKLASADGPGSIRVVKEKPMESDPELQPRRVMVPKPEPLPPLDIEKPPVTLGQLRTALMGTAAIRDIHFRKARAYDGRTGWKLRWAQDPRLSDMFGLQRGDVLIEINGVEVDEIRDFSSVASTLATVSEIILTIQRGNRPARIVIPINAI